MGDAVAVLACLEEQVSHDQGRVGPGYVEADPVAEPGRYLVPAVEHGAVAAGVDWWRKAAAAALTGGVPADALAAAADPVGDYLRVNNTHLPPDQVATAAVTHFRLPGP